MRMKAANLFCFSLIVGAASAQQQPVQTTPGAVVADPERTFGLLNGRHWNRYSQGRIQLPEMPRELPEIPSQRPDGNVTTGDIRARASLQQTMAKRFGELYADAQVQRATAAMWEKGILEGILQGWLLRQLVTNTAVLEKDPLLDSRPPHTPQSWPTP
jgi:hypothetical protein